MASPKKHKQRSQRSYYQTDRPFAEFTHRASVKKTMKAKEAKKSLAQRLASIFHKTTDKKGE